MAKTKVLNRKTYYTGDTIITQGDMHGMRAYYINSGHVEVLVQNDGHELQIATLKAGDIFGEMSLINDTPRAATVRATDACNVTVISREEIEKKLENLEDPAIGSLLHILVKRLQGSNKGQLDQYIKRTKFENRIVDIQDRVARGVKNSKDKGFKTEIEPLLDQLEIVLNKYS